MAQFDEHEVRRRLLAARERIEATIFNRTEGDAQVIPVDPLDEGGGLNSYQADNAGPINDADRENAEVGNGRDLLDEVNAALARLDAGTYGICARCGKEIPARRLEALPYALYDVECEAILEREGVSPAGQPRG